MESYNRFEIKKEQIHTQVVVNKTSLEVSHLLSSYQYMFPKLNFKVSLEKIEEVWKRTQFLICIANT